MLSYGCNSLFPGGGIHLDKIVPFNITFITVSFFSPPEAKQTLSIPLFKKKKTRFLAYFYSRILTNF
jgi:hypothetical protein